MFRIEDHGSIVLVRPLTEDVEAWLDEHVSEDARYFGGALVVEPRYVEALVERSHRGRLRRGGRVSASVKPGGTMQSYTIRVGSEDRRPGLPPRRSPRSSRRTPSGCSRTASWRTPCSGRATAEHRREGDRLPAPRAGTPARGGRRRGQAAQAARPARL